MIHLTIEYIVHLKDKCAMVSVYAQIPLHNNIQ